MVVDEPRSKATSRDLISSKTSKISPKVSVKSLKKSPIYKKGSRHLNIIKTFKNTEQEESTSRSKGTKTKKIQIKKSNKTKQMNLSLSSSSSGKSKPTSKNQTSDVVQTMTKQVSYLTELIKNPFADPRGNCSAKKNTRTENAVENCWKSGVLKKLSKDSNMGIDILKQKDKKRLYNPIPKFDFDKLRKHIFQLFTLRTVETPKNEVRLLKNVKNQKPGIEDSVETKRSIKTEDKSTVTDDLKRDASPSTKKKDKPEEINVLPSKKRELKPVNEEVVSECQSKKETRGSETSSSKSSSLPSKVIYELKPIERVVMTFEEKNKQAEKLKDDQFRRKVVEEKVVYRSKCVTEDIVWLNASYRTRFPTESDLRQLSARNKQTANNGIKRFLDSKKTNDFSKTQPNAKHIMSPVHSSPAESYNSLSSASSSDSFNLYYSKEADLSSPWFDQRNFSEVNFNNKSFPKRKYEAQMKALENNNLKISRRPMDISFAQKDINFPPINLLTAPEDTGLNQRQKRKRNISRHEDKIIEMEDESTDNETSSVSTARTKSATTDVGSQCNSLSKRWIKKQEKLIQERKRSSSLGDESRRKSKTREIIEEFLNKYRSILRYRCKRTEESLQEKKMAKSTHRVKKVYYDAVNVLPEKRDSADNFYKSPNVTESTKLLHSNLGRDMISLNPAYFLERVKRKNEPGQSDREERLKKVIARIEKDMFIQDNTFHRRFRYP